MSRKRQDTTASQRSMGDFVSRAGSRNPVEIIDDEDDEVEEINTQEVMESNTSSRLLRTRRQRREAEQEHMFSDDEPNDEWQGLQQVLILSKIEAEKQEERRKMCGTMQDVMNLQVQIEPLNSNRSKSVATETGRKTTGNQEDQREGAESPDLFVTPPEDQEQLSDKVDESDPEFPNSPPLPVTMRSPDPNGKGGKETNSQQTASAGSSLRQDKGDTRRKFSLRRSKREAADLSSQKENKLEEKSTLSDSEVRDQVIQSGNSKSDDVNPGEKRKLEEHDDDVTDDEDEEPLGRLKRNISLKRKKPWVSLENSDSEDMQDVDKRYSKRSPDGLHGPSPKRIAASDTEKAKRNGKEPSAETRQIRTPTSMIRLSRRYKKTRCRPANLKEAMKANIYFAPPGFDLPAYTVLIIRMFEKFRRQLYVAQSKVKTRIPWGPPVLPGIRETLELQQPRRSTASIGTRASVGRNSLHGATGTDTKIQSEFDISDRKRSLRSSSDPVKQATASTSASKASSATVPPYKVDSDSDDGDYLKSYLDEMARPSVSSSTKKPAPSLSRNRGRSNIGLAEDRGSGKTEATGEHGSQTKSSSDGVTSNVQLKDDRREETGEPVVGEQSSWDDANVVSDPEASEIQSNTVGSSAGTLKDDSKITANSGTGRTKLDNENSSSESRVLPESKTTDNNVGLMDPEQEKQAEITRPPKRRRVLRSPISDNSTDDEGDSSQPMFSIRFPGKEALLNSLCLSVCLSDSGDVAGNHEQDPLAGQSLSPQSDSQGMVGKSILDTMAAAGEELLPSQTLLESDLTTNKQMEEASEDGSFDVAGTSSSAASSSINQAKEGLADEEKEVVDVDSSGSERLRRTRSAEVEKAAAAAERRHQMASRRNVTEACPPSSRNDYFSTSKLKDAEAKACESTVECPLCYEHFASKEIEAHASDCQGPTPQASYCSQMQSEETGTRSEPGPSIRSVPARADANPLPSVYRTLTGERGKLKHLRVVLQRSPIAKQKLLQKTTQETDSAKAKRSLAFEKDSRLSGNIDQYCSSRSSDQDSRKPSRNTRAALRTESESEESGYVREKEESSSAEVYSWLDASSPERKKPKHTYGSSCGGNAPKLGGDYIPLNVAVESDEDGATEKTSKEQVPRKTVSRRTEEEESGSDTSDDDLMVQYGAQRVSQRKKEPKQVQTDEMDENEIALALLGGNSKKRPLSLSKGSKAKKSRRQRDSDSEESDESSIVCELCDKKIPKELYRQHVDEELETRRRAKRNVPRKAEVVTVKDRRQGNRKDEPRRSSTRVQAQKSVPGTSTATEDTENDDVDWDRVSNSPIKCFQFTENSNSVVDFENQFEHLKETKSGTRRSNYGQNDASTRENRGGYRGFGARGGYRGSGNRGNYRGSYKKVYGRGKKYGKYRGSRGRK